MSIVSVPWIVAGLGAVSFALLARRVKRSQPLWGLAGGFFGLVVTTIIWGLGQAAAVPFSDHQRIMFHLRWTLEAVVIVALAGVLMALCLKDKSGEPKPALKP